MKKLITLFMIAALIITAIPLTATAADILKPGDFIKDPIYAGEEVIGSYSGINRGVCAEYILMDGAKNPAGTVDVIVFGDRLSIGEYGAVATLEGGRTYHGKITNYSDGFHASFVFEQPINSRYEIYVSLNDNGSGRLTTGIATFINGVGGINFNDSADLDYWDKVEIANANPNSVLSLVTVKDGHWKLNSHKEPEPTGPVWAGSSGAHVSLPIIKQTFSAGAANFAIKEDGSLWGWGKNGSGNALIGNGEIGGPFTPGPDDVLKPIKILDNVKFVGRSAAIKNDNSLWIWGREMNFSNNRGEAKINLLPVKIMDDVQYVDNWTDSVMVIKTDGSLWVWGTNSVSNPLGTGTAENVYTPVKILDNVVQASWGSPSLALTKDGKLYAWGLKHFYLNVDGDVYNIAHSWTEKGIERVYSNQAKDANSVWMKPQKVMDGVLSFSNSGYATLIIKADNSLWGWGNNFWGDMSDSVPWRADVDTLHKIMDNVRAVKSGSGTTLAIKTDDTLWSWGSQETDNFRLGDGLLKREDGGHIRATPMKIMDNVADVSMDYYHAFALKKDGSLWAWGSGATAGIGDGTHTFRPTPIKVMDGVKLPTAATIQPPPALVAKPTSSTVLVNGKNVAFDAYSINGNNYFKLRDLAYILSDTEKQFEVGWDVASNAISLTSGKPYTAVGGEMTGKGTGDKTPAPTSSKIHLDSKEVQFTAYNIDGNNYFKLRDIGAAFDFGVDWDDANNTIVIDTKKGYTPE